MKTTLRSRKKSAPRKTAAVSAYLDVELKRKVEILADRQKRSTANMVAFLIAEGVTHLERQNQPPAAA